VSEEKCVYVQRNSFSENVSVKQMICTEDGGSMFRVDVCCEERYNVYSCEELVLIRQTASRHN
jgi:hypothetical protein